MTFLSSEQANATYSRIIGTCYELIKHCEEVENHCSFLEAEAFDAKESTDD